MKIGRRNCSIIELILLVLLIVTGFIFISSLPVLFNLKLALMIHSDLSPDAGYLMIMVKSVICFLTGISYLIAAFYLHRHSPLIIIGAFGAFPFFILYLIEIMLWGQYYSPVWIGFSTFGLISLIIGISCIVLRYKWKRDYNII